MVRGVLLISLVLVNTLAWGTPILILGLLKLVLPPRARHYVVRWASEHLAENWVAFNDRIFDALLTTEWDVSGLEGLHHEGRYLVISNHVSWVDIFVLFRIFRDRSSFPRFFMKYPLIWFPVVGLACWGLDFPFMKRYSREFLEKYPEKRGEDLETTRRVCLRFRGQPVTILNFLEGTRFTRAKHDAQRSPFRHLLRPRIGGIAFVFASLGDQLDATVDVTIAYPGRDMTLWAFATNRVPRITVRAKRLDVPPEFREGAITRPGAERDAFRDWIESLWRDKDELLDTLTA